VAEILIDALPFAPTAGKVERVVVRAVYFEGQLDTKTFRADHRHYPVLFADPLVIEPQRGAYVVLTKFGALVFWNCPEPLQSELLKEVTAARGAKLGAEKIEDTLDVFVGQNENTVTFNEVGLRELTLDKLKIISLALAQSVALDHIEHEVAAALGKFDPVVAELRDEGRLRLKEKEVLKAVGFAQGVRSAVLANLTLFDKPPETWESEILERLDGQLYDFFDLEERLSAINQKMSYFSEMNATLMNLLNHRKSVRLEWIVIILIALEVVIFIWFELYPRRH
jgi:required for meiotic nuclear division protein 1